jgi:hypothetical protein
VRRVSLCNYTRAAIVGKFYTLVKVANDISRMNYTAAFYQHHGVQLYVVLGERVPAAAAVPKYGNKVPLGERILIIYVPKLW